MFRKSSLTLQMIAATLAIGTMSSVLADNDAAMNFSPYWYVGGAIAPGTSSKNTNSSTLYNIKTKQSISGTDYWSSTNAPGWGLFGGYRGSQHFAVEFGYYNWGQVKTDHNLTSSASTSTIFGQNKSTSSDFVLSSLIMLPIQNWNLAPYVRMGMAYHDYKNQTDETINGSPNWGFGSGSGSNIYFVYGFGLQYDLNTRVALRADYIINNAYAILQQLNGGNAVFSVAYKF